MKNMVYEPLDAAIARQEGRKVEGLRILSYAEMAAMPEPEWLVEGVIQKRSTGLMFGKSNSFKSFLAIDIGLSVATGHDWHGNAVCKGKVLFVATEGANGVGRQRVPAWLDHYGIGERDRQGVHLYPQEICLDRTDDVSALIASVSSLGLFALVVVDIFGGSMAGSEIEDKTARAWVHGVQRILRETGAAVLVVAHTGWQDDTRARMHTHFWGSFDSRIRVEGDKDALTSSLSIERHKDADSSGSWGFLLEKTGSSLVPVINDAVKPSRGRNLTVKQRIALDALDDAIKTHGLRKTGEDWPPCNVVLVEHWREAAYRHGITGSDKANSRKKAFHLHKDALIGKGVIRVFDEYAWRCF